MLYPLQDALSSILLPHTIKDMGLFRDWLVEKAGILPEDSLKCAFIYDKYHIKGKVTLFFKIPVGLALPLDVLDRMQGLLNAKEKSKGVFLVNEEELVTRLIPVFESELSDYLSARPEKLIFYQQFSRRNDEQAKERVAELSLALERLFKSYQLSMRTSDVLEHRLFKMAGVTTLPEHCATLMGCGSSRVDFEFSSPEYQEENIQLLLNLFKQFGDLSAHVMSASRCGRADVALGYELCASGYKKETHLDRTYPIYPYEKRPVSYMVSVDGLIMMETILPKLARSLEADALISTHRNTFFKLKTSVHIPREFESVMDRETDQFVFDYGSRIKEELGQFGFESFILFKHVMSGRLDAVEYFVEKNPQHLDQINKKGQTIRAVAEKRDHTDIVNWIDAFKARLTSPSMP